MEGDKPDVFSERNTRFQSGLDNDALKRKKESK